MDSVATSSTVRQILKKTQLSEKGRNEEEENTPGILLLAAVDDGAL
jgi:hypothetical protein